jgi:anti-sigma factor RsiW
MNCNEIRELMPDLAAGMSAATPETESHLQTCANCSNELAEFRKTMALLDEWQAPEPSQYFDVRLQARLREEMAKQPVGWLQWIRRPALAVSLGLVIAVSATMFRTDGGPHIAQVEPGAQVVPGTAVSDLQALDSHDLISDSDSDVLDDLEVQSNVTANP